MPKWSKVLLWLGISLLGALALGTIALHRGEEINAHVAGGGRSVQLRDRLSLLQQIHRRQSAGARRHARHARRTPGERPRLCPHEQVGRLRPSFRRHRRPRAARRSGARRAVRLSPGTLWILVGAVFGGCVQDFVILLFSVRRDGKSLGQMAREEIGRLGGFVAYVAVISIIVILLASSRWLSSTR